MTTPDDADSVLTPDVDPTARARPVEPGAPVPDLAKTAEAIARPRNRSVGITVLTVLALLYTLYFARTFLIPVVFALLLNFLLSPAIRALGRWHVRAPIAAAFVVLGLVGAMAGAGYALAQPAQRWAVTAPASLRRAEGKLRAIFAPVQKVQETADEVQKAAGGAVGGAGDDASTLIVREERSLAARLFGTTERIITGTIEVLILLYFLLAGGDLFLQKLIKVLPKPEDKRRAVEVARATEAAVSRFLSTALMVNVTEGLIVGTILWALGVPGAPAFGAMVALLLFIPFLGAATSIVVLAVTGVTTFDSIGRALLVPGAFVLVNTVQANIVSPMLQGHRLTLNPVAIFLGLTFFYFIWGIPGAFLAVPMLASFKILCDYVPSLAAVGEFLRERDDEERRRTVRVGEAVRAR